MFYCFFLQGCLFHLVFYWVFLQGFTICWSTDSHDVLHFCCGRNAGEMTRANCSFQNLSSLRQIGLILVSSHFQLFGKIELNDDTAITVHNNFQTFPQAILVLFR